MSEYEDRERMKAEAALNVAEGEKLRAEAEKLREGAAPVSGSRIVFAAMAGAARAVGSAAGIHLIWAAAVVAVAYIVVALGVRG